MITPSFSLTATERVLPKLALDFTTALLDPRVTFTRTGATATRVNSSGYIETVTADTARFDYDPVTLACRGLLIEESRINVALYSADFTQAATWVKAATTTPIAAETFPNGDASGVALIESATSAPHYIVQNVAAVTNGATYTYTVYAKYNGRNLQLAFGGADVTGDPWANYDLQTGVLGTVSAGIIASITPAGNGWYRCVATVTAATATSFGIVIGLAPTTILGRIETYQGDGVSGAFIYGAQLEAGAFPTSYIPTTTTALTRNADVATMTGTNFSDWFNASEGTFDIQCSLPSTVSKTMLAVSNGTSTGEVYQIITNSLGETRFQVYAGSASQALISSGYTTSPNTAFSCAAAYKVNNFAVSANGQNTATDLAGAVAAPNQLFLFKTGSGVTDYSGVISSLSYWPQRLINPELQAFSKG